MRRVALKKKIRCVQHLIEVHSNPKLIVVQPEKIDFNFDSAKFLEVVVAHEIMDMSIVE